MVILASRNSLDQDEDPDEGLDGDEVESDSDSGLGGSVPPCSVIFVGANVSTGKSSMRGISRNNHGDKKVAYIFYYSQRLFMLG